MLSNRVQPQITGQAHLSVSPVVATNVTVVRMGPPPLAVYSPRTPGVVQLVSVLWGLMLIATGLAMVCGFLAIPFSDPATYNGCCALAPVFACVLWFGLNLRARSKRAWQAQVILSIIGIFLFPLGTIINTLIIAAWFSPATKEWFGVDKPSARRVTP